MNTVHNRPFRIAQSESKPDRSTLPPKHLARIDFVQDLLNQVPLDARSIKQLSDGQLNALKGLLKSWIEVKEEALRVPAFEMGAGESATENTYIAISAVAPQSFASEFAMTTTCVNTLTGLIAAEQGIRAAQKSQKNQDVSGLIDSVLDTLGSLSQSLGGLFTCGILATDIAAYIKDIKSSPDTTGSLDQANSLFQTISNAFFTIFYALTGIKAGYLLGKNIQWRQKMEKAEAKGDLALLEFFHKKTCADPSKKLEKLSRSLKGRVEIRQEMHDKGLDKITTQFLRVQKQGAEALSYTQAKEGFESLLTLLESEKNWKGKKAEFEEKFLSAMGLEGERKKAAKSQIATLNWDPLALVGFQQSEKERLERKQAKFSRVADEKSLVLIEKAAHRGLKERLEDPKLQAAARAELIDLKSRVTKANTKQMIIQSVLIAIAVIGFTASVLGFLTLNPAGAIALIVLTVLYASITFGLDVHGLYQAWKSETRPGVHDKTFAAFIGALMLASLGGASAVTILYKLSPVGLISTAVTCMLGLIVAIASYLIATHKQNKWDRNHPSSEHFYEELKSLRSVSGDKISPEILERFKKLPKKERRAIYNLYLQEAKIKPLSFDAQQLTGNEGEVLLRAVKKTTRIFWKKWEETHSADTLDQAKKLQQLQDQIRAQKTWDGHAANDLNQELQKLQNGDQEAFDDLSKHVWYFRKIREGKSSVLQKHMETFRAATP